ALPRLQEGRPPRLQRHRRTSAWDGGAAISEGARVWTVPACSGGADACAGVPGRFVARGPMDNAGLDRAPGSAGPSLRTQAKRAHCRSAPLAAAPDGLATSAQAQWGSAPCEAGTDTGL